MCGRYITPDASALEREWGRVPPADFRQSWNLAPSQLAPVIRIAEDGATDLGLLVWGFQPGWSKRSWINARAETVFASKAFASAARKRRCIVPAIGWYEWQGKAAPRQPYVFHRDGFVPFAFAGIWTAREVDDGWQRTFAIVTTEASGELARIHHRKPVALTADAQRQWLDPSLGQEQAESVLGLEGPEVDAYRVSTYVNKPQNNDAQCIAPLDDAS